MVVSYFHVIIHIVTPFLLKNEAGGVMFLVVVDHGHGFSKLIGGRIVLGTESQLHFFAVVAIRVLVRQQLEQVILAPTGRTGAAFNFLGHCKLNQL